MLLTNAEASSCSVDIPHGDGVKTPLSHLLLLLIIINKKAQLSLTSPRDVV